MRQTIQDSVRAGEKITRTAERLLDADAPLVELPRYVRELSDAARLRPGEPNAYAAAVKRWQGQVARLGQGAELKAGEYTIQSATRELVRKLQTAKPEQIDKVVNRWILEKARYQARVIARHESVEAARRSARESLSKQPWNHGVRWTLSGAHAKPDQCDLYASVDMHGLGPGGYPLDKVPAKHVSCTCFEAAIVDQHYQDRELAKARGEEEPPKPWLSGKQETPEDWLRSQPVSALRSIVGPNRAELVRKGHKVLEPGAAGFRPVHELLGRSKTVRTTGRVADVRPLIAADRASMVRPLPRLKRTGSGRS
jgi:hypothetical protein